MVTRFLIPLLIFGVVASSLAAEPTLLGEFEGRRYRNEHFGLDLTIPETWELKTDGIGAKVAELAERRKPELEKEHAALRPQLQYVLNAKRKSDAKPGEPWLTITVVVHRGGAQNGLSTSELYAKRYLRDIGRGSDELKLISEVSNVRLNGTPYARARYFSRVKDMAINQSIYVRVAGEDVLALVAYYGGPEHIQMFESIIRETEASAGQ